MGLRQKNGSLLYSILEIPDEFGPDRVLKIILDLGWVSGTRVLVGHCSQPVFETDQLLLYVNFPFIFFAFEKYVWSLPTSVIPIPTVAANTLTLI